ncbi:MAG: glutamine synthetase family protein [Pseudomonadota bacterium]
MSASELSDWAKARPSLTCIKPVICDLNGVFRGKRLPVAEAPLVASGGVKMPVTAVFFDIWGRDVYGTGQVLETGDHDGVLVATQRGPLALEFSDGTQEAIVPHVMHLADGSPYPADPRNALQRVVDRFQAQGLTPVCAMELEFYVFAREAAEANGGVPAPMADAAGGARANTYSIAELDAFEPFLDQVYAACAAFDIPAQTGISEAGSGQFEINFSHSADPMKAADDAVLFKYLVKRLAQKNGLGVTFMAKPYATDSGSGFHTHMSVVDQQGRNIFADGSEQGSDTLRFAVGGLLDTLAETTLVLAPHANSFRRLRIGSHAPANVTWGYDNRTVALRIPAGPDASRRIEHRVAGADANPYLVLAAILGGALDGMAAKADPGAPSTGNAYESDAPRLPPTWSAAIDAFDASQRARAIFGDLLVDLYAAGRRQERDQLDREIPPAEYAAYLTSV